MVGASFYTFPLTRGKQWRVLRHIPVNPVEKPSLPATLGTFAGELGNIPGGDQTHPKEVFFTTDGKAGAWELHFDAFDVQRAEVDILVNWKPLAHVAEGRRDEWTGARTRRVPDRYLTRRGDERDRVRRRGRLPGLEHLGRAIGEHVEVLLGPRRPRRRRGGRH